MERRGNRLFKNSGNAFVSSLIFLFVLIGTLRMCCEKTLHEAKLTSIFIQETQGYYLLENLMALARDYAYQIVQNPREPNLFLSPNAYRTKDKSQNANTYVIDFNGSLSKEQIVPNDFPLQITDNGWDIKGGPIFWKDNRKNANDERYISEVFMLGSLNLISNLLPNWTAHTVQTMEIERNPLCDFQLYAEGDITINTNIAPSSWAMTFSGPIQINGNARFSQYNGDKANNITFQNKLNFAGHAIEINNKSVEDYILPEKYHLFSTHDFYTNVYNTGYETYKLNVYNSTTPRQIDCYNKNPSPVSANTYDDYARFAYDTYKGNLNPYSRIYRPCGFDPENYYGWWDTTETRTSDPSIDKDKFVLNYCFGLHNFAQSSAQTSHDLYSEKYAAYSPTQAMQKLRGLNAYQMTEKARLVELQKPITGPGITLTLMINDNIPTEGSSLYVNNNFIYPTYIAKAFPPTKDNIFLNRYLKLKTQHDYLLFVQNKFLQAYGNNFFSLDNATQPTTSPNIQAHPGFHDNLVNNKLGFSAIRNTYPSIPSTFILEKNSFPLSSYNNDNYPPSKLVDCTTHWEIDNYVTRITTNESYNFLYDRNRAKWIQIIDFDIGALKDAIDSEISMDVWDKARHTILINTRWQGEKQPTRNYKINDSQDIRIDYATNRETFFDCYKDGSYNLPTGSEPVIDLGIRLINAEELPTGGLTFYSPYPIYIKGDFNTINTKPALIITDSITVLSPLWQDWRSSMDYYFSKLYYDGSKYTSHVTFSDAQVPTIYADIMTGRTHPYFWIKTPDITEGKQTYNPQSDFGIHDTFRTLEDLTERIKFHGSILLPYHCQEQWEPPIDFCKTTRNPVGFAYPNIDIFSRADVGIPACMPFYYKINRGRKTHCLGKTAYETLAGTTLYNKDWATASNTFSDYHTALPNYLKYETAP